MRRWILVAVSLVACSSETSSGVPARGPIPLDGWYSESARVQCEQMFRCCDKSKLSTGTLDECAALLAKRELEEEQEIKAAVAAGKLSYDGAAARKCLDAQAALPCEAFGHEFDPACNAIIKGMAAEGQACERHYECVTRLCTGSMTAPAEQTCQHVPLVGEVCDLVGCDWDVAYCDDSSPRKCVAKKENGSPCSYSNECVSEYCDPTSRTCAALKPNGSPCSVYSECASGFCDETRTCRTDLESLCR